MRSLKKKNAHTHIYINNNRETHTPYQTTYGCGHWGMVHTHTHSQKSQHINAYTISTDRRMRSLKKKHTHTHTQQQQHINAYTISNDRWMMPLKTKAITQTHAYTTTITQKRIQHVKRTPAAVVGTKKTHTNTYTHIYICIYNKKTINAYTISNDSRVWSL